MAISSSFSDIQRCSCATQLFKGSSLLNNTSLFTRSNCLLGLYAGGVTVYSLYNLYQAYRLRSHTNLGLDDRFKLVKCQTLLAKAKTQDVPNAQPLLQQCEAGLASITSTWLSADKERLLLELIRCYAKETPDRSYRVAARLSSPSNLLAAAQCIQKESSSFDPAKLTTLCAQTFEAWKQQVKSQQDHQRRDPTYTPSMNVYTMLDYVKAFHSLKHLELANQCMTQALELIRDHKNDFNLFRVLCHIALCYQTIEQVDQRDVFITRARSLLLDGSIVDADAAEARLMLATTFFSCIMPEVIDQELGQVVDQLADFIQQNDPLATIKNLYPLAELVDKIKKDKKNLSHFKIFRVETFIEKVVEALDALPSEPTTHANRAKAYLTIASIYDEGLLEDDASIKETLLGKVFQHLLDFSSETKEATHSKVDLLIHLSCFYGKNSDKTREIVQILERVYDQLSVAARLDSHVDLDKSTLGYSILRRYNRAGLKADADAFLQKHIQYLQTRPDQDACGKIISLVTGATFFIPELHSVIEEQREVFLQAAEKLLPQITSSIEYKNLLLQLIEGYLKVDLKKGLTLLENYENQQAKSYLITAVVTPIIAGIGYFFPPFLPLLSFGATLVRPC